MTKKYSEVTLPLGLLDQGVTMFGILGNSKSQAKSQGKVLALLNQKGGVGKTTMAFNVAHALMMRGSKVLCIDMDPQANLGLLFGHDSRESTGNIFHLLVNSIRELKPLHTAYMLSDVIFPVISENGTIDLLPAGQELSGLELTVAGINYPRQLILKKFIEKNDLLKIYDYIVIDGPPTLGLIVVNILSAANGVLVPFQPDQFSEKGLENFHQVVQDIEEMGITETPKILGYIPNLVDKRRKQVSEDLEKITATLDGAPVFDGFTNKVQLVKSSAMKKSVFSFKAQEFQELQDQFLTMADHIQKEL